MTALDFAAEEGLKGDLLSSQRDLDVPVTQNPVLTPTFTAFDQRSRPGPQHAGQDQDKTEVHSVLFMVKGYLDRNPTRFGGHEKDLSVHGRLVPSFGSFPTHLGGPPAHPELTPVRLEENSTSCPSGQQS